MTESNLSLNFGPQHPAAHGVLRLIMEMDGEVVKHLDPHIGLLHRGTEKPSDIKPDNNSIGYMDRMEYLLMMNCDNAYFLTINILLTIYTP